MSHYKIPLDALFKHYEFHGKACEQNIELLNSSRAQHGQVTSCATNAFYSMLVVL